MRAATLTAAAVLLISAAAGRSGGAGFYDPSQNHDRIISAALSEAADQKKRVFVEVGMEGCPSVRRLDSLIARDREIAAAIEQGYVHLRFSIHGADQSKWVKSHLPRLHATPSLFVLDETGRLLYTQEPMTLESGGNYDRVRVMRFLGTWATPVSSAPVVEETQILMPEIPDLSSPKVVAAELPVVVYYYLPKSPEGKDLTTALENISVDLSEKAQFYTIDAGKAGAALPAGKTAPIPRLLLLKGGKRRTVALPEENREEDKLRALLGSWLAR